MKTLKPKVTNILGRSRDESVLLYLVLFGKIYKCSLIPGKLLWDLGLLG